MKTPRIEELIEENRVIVDGRGYIPVKVALEIYDTAHQAGKKEGHQDLFPRKAVVGQEIHLPDLYHIKVWRLVEFADYPPETLQDNK